MDTSRDPRDTASAGAQGRTRGDGMREPYLPLLHGSMLLSGFGTVFLGPLLPALAAGSHTSDSGSGLFFTAQFIGAFLGGVTTSSRLWLSLLRGSGSAAAGFALLALCVAWHAALPWHLAALLPLGFGVGQMLTSVNLLASRRFAAQRGSALSLVNFSWSLGAVLGPFLLGSMLQSIRLSVLLLGAAGLFLLAFMGGAWNRARGKAAQEPGKSTSATDSRLNTPAFLYFAFLLLLYGGVETSLSGWITTFATRYGSGTLRTAALGTTALWIGITAGRALAPLLLKVVREQALLVASLVMAVLLTGLLLRSQGAVAVPALAALLGLALASWFPLVLSSMLGEGAGATQVGSIIAVSGIGAATLPLLLGTVSRATGSLRVALMVPLSGLILLLLCSFRRAGARASGSFQGSQESV